jgi:hypothetical protein
LISLILPSWLNKGEIVKLKAAATAWWALVENWVQWPLTQLDAETCVEPVLDLLAWERDINRFDGEPLSLYRLRVKYAKVNAEDAGSVAGIKRIFQRLGVGYVEVVERETGIDWDIIILRMSDSQLSQNPTLLQVLVAMYGRTCRRYQFEVIADLPLQMREIELFGDYYYDRAEG